MRILMVGDVVGQLGCSFLKENLPILKKKYSPDAIIVNGENAAKNGRGITKEIINQFFNLGVNCITLGNHAWAQQEILDYIEDEKRLIRPANFLVNNPGSGVHTFKTTFGNLSIINLMGRTFMPPVNCPFVEVDKILKEVNLNSSYILVDMHSEASSDKQAIAHYLDGRVSCVVGTHTHIQTNDNRKLRKGTGYITDVGMVGPYDGVIGMDKDLIIKKYLTNLPIKFELAKGSAQLNAVIIDLDRKTKMTKSIVTIRIDDENPLIDSF